MIDRIENELNKRKIPCGRDRVERLLGYMDLILEKNRSINLTSITDREEFVDKHIIDSLSCSVLPEFGRAKTIIDVGTGGGFPGIPLAVFFPEKDFVLVDALRKRLIVIEEFCERLNIGNVRLRHGRAEDLGREEDLREGFDLCVSRAVASLPVLSELCLPFVKIGGSFVAYKGQAAEEELAQAEKAIRILGGGPGRIQGEEQEAPVTIDGHRFVVIDKISSTPEKYPRRAGMPAKRPL